MADVHARWTLPRGKAESRRTRSRRRRLARLTAITGLLTVAVFLGIGAKNAAQRFSLSTTTQTVRLADATAAAPAAVVPTAAAGAAATGAGQKHEDKGVQISAILFLSY